MPSKPLSLWAIATINKETQFSKAERMDTPFYNVNLVLARSEEEVNEVAKGRAGLYGKENIRAIVYKIADPTTLFRLGKVSAEPKTLTRAGSFA